MVPDPVLPLVLTKQVRPVAHAVDDRAGAVLDVAASRQHMLTSPRRQHMLTVCCVLKAGPGLQVEVLFG